MLVIAHAGHWAFAALEFLPVIAIAAFALWRTYSDSDHAAGAVEPRRG